MLPSLDVNPSPHFSLLPAVYGIAWSSRYVTNTEASLKSQDFMKRRRFARIRLRSGLPLASSRTQESGCATHRSSIGRPIGTALIVKPRECARLSRLHLHRPGSSAHSNGRHVPSACACDSYRCHRI